MNIFDVFAPGEIEELPDDPREAFIRFVRKTQSALDEAIEQAIQEDQENGWRYADEHRHDFMSMVVAAAKRFDIAVFRTRDVPEKRNWGYDEYKEFSSELNHYLTQVVLDNAIRGKSDSIELPLKSKDRIRQHIHALKKLVDAANLDPDKKASMLVKLERFEQELDKRRLPLSAVGLLAITLLSAPGGIWQSWEMANKLIANVFDEVHAAKTIDDERRLITPTSEPAQLSPPRQPISGFTGPRPRPTTPAFESGGMDDDIPF